MATLDLAIETARLETAKQDLAQAQQSYDAGARALLASDGRTPIHAQPEHDAKTQALRDKLTAAAAGVDSAADGVLTRVEAARLDEHADGLAALDLAQLNLAGLYRPFVAEDCAALPVDQLTARLEWAAQSKDKGLAFCYARYGLARFAALLATDPQPAGLAEVRQALEALGAIGPARGLTPEAEKLRYAAQALKRAAAGARAGKRTVGTGAPMGI